MFNQVDSVSFSGILWFGNFVVGIIIFFVCYGSSLIVEVPGFF